VILVGQRCAEQRHDPIAHHLVDGAFIAVDGLHHSREQDEEIIFNAGTHTLTAKLAFADFVRLTEPRMVDVAVQR
jgi:hypothetical protein